MLKNTFSSWNKKRLRLILTLFFLALVIPTAILINQAYSQLKWESFYHYRLQAEELSSRIDLQYKELIETESARTFTDYSFLNIAGNIQSNVLQRSPLSAYPVNSKFPGIIGYFQIDNLGKFTTPLLPATEASKFLQNVDYGINAEEKVKRLKIHNNIYQVLSQNKLINKPTIKMAKKETSGIVTADAIELENKNIDPATTRSDITRQPEPLSLSSAAATSLTQEHIIPQAAFDKLQSQQAYSAKEKTNRYSVKRQRVEDLKLKKQYQKKSIKQDKPAAISKYKNEKKKISRRVESNILPQLTNEAKKIASKKDRTLRLNMFESEINAFEFSMLKSGHFVLYRKVWKNSLRYIQGLLIKPDIFINSVIEQSFYKTNVSNASILTVAYKGNILSTINSKASRRSYPDDFNSQQDSVLQGTLLLQNKLSDTLAQLELIFSVNNLPAGPGGTVLNWISFILLLILCGGFLVLYFLGLKQITLARQQQDFVSAVSHELKTPLTSIRMYGEILREGWTTEEKRKQYYNYIYEESERLTRLINNVLQLARMTRNELPVDLKPCTVAILIDNIHSKISSQVERARFKLALRCSENIKEKEILVDADYFIQVIINLVDNAIKFSAKAEVKKIDIQCKPINNSKIQFTVRDYGPGIAKNQVKKIFKLFYRTENELTRETVGTGIGLSLVKQLIGSMNAKIDITRTNPGTEFQITFDLV